MKQPAKNCITRREALRRLGLGTVAAYVVPNVIMVSAARASTGGSSVSPASSSGPAGSAGSDPSVATPPTPPSVPSNAASGESDEAESDTCRSERAGAVPDSPTISTTDYLRAQEAVEAGYAKPLHQIWDGIQADYQGRFISIEFTGFRYRPRYRFRAVSPSGRLETVIVSARTGSIVRIVGC